MIISLEMQPALVLPAFFLNRCGLNWFDTFSTVYRLASISLSSRIRRYDAMCFLALVKISAIFTQALAGR